MYLAGALLLFFLAVGVGAMAAFVVGRQLGAAPTGTGGISTPEGSGLETTRSAAALESTAIEPSGDSESSDGTTNEASFVHRATEKNCRGDYTYISDPNINGDSNAVVLASPTAVYGHNIGVWYEPVANRWAIFNQDRAPVSAGATFEVEVPEASEKFIHRASLLNTAGNYTYLDNQLTNGEPDAVLSVTQNWNPGGGTGVYNNHPVGTLYDAKVDKWAVYNRDGAPIPEGAAFNIAVSTGANESAR